MTPVPVGLPPAPLEANFSTVEIRGDGSPHGRVVLMDGIEASHVDLADALRLEFEYLRHLAALIDLARPVGRELRVLQVGGGPCTLARRLTAAGGDARVVVVERDGALIEIARKWLGLVPSPRLGVVVGDGRDEIRGTESGSLDLVVIDAFVGRAVPFHLVTAEFVDEVRGTLRAGGLHVVNLIDDPPLTYTASVAATLQGTFTNVLAMADREVLAGRSSGNVVLAASDQALPAAKLSRSAARDRSPWTVLAGRAARSFVSDAPQLSDDASTDARRAALGSLWEQGRPQTSQEASARTAS